MWLWNSPAILSNTGTARSELFTFCSAPHGRAENRVTHVYLYAHQQLSNSPAAVRQFVREAHVNGLKVHYLDGAADWAGTGLSYAKATMDRVMNYQRTSLPDERFDGIQYDVEPYLLSTWGTNEAGLWSGYIELLAYCQAQANAFNSSYTTPVTFEACIPRWYDSDASAVTSSEQVQDLVDAVVLMDYVNTASRIITDGTTEVSYADLIGKQVVLGVETIQIEPATSTFYGFTNADMETVLGDVEAAFAQVSGFGGMAVHHYDSYRAMASGAPQAPVADLAVTLTAATSAPKLNVAFTYALTVKNMGAANANSVNAVLSLPTSLNFNGANCSAGVVSRSGQTVTCSVTTLAPGDTLTVWVSVTPKAIGNVTTIGEAYTTTAESSAANNQASLTLNVKKK